jgi:hypothetical protein
MSNPARLLRDYFFWTYERGSLHYDVMVTLILLFLFLSPHFIDFKDRPVTDVGLQPTQVLVRHSGASGCRHEDHPAYLRSCDRGAHYSRPRHNRPHHGI